MTNLDIEKIGIKVKIVESNKTKAIISLNFGDFVVKGFRVQTSRYENRFGEKFWLTPPSYQDGIGKYHPMFYMDNKELWNKLEEKIYREFEKQSIKYYADIYETDEKEIKESL